MAFYQALKATGSPILKAAYHPWIRGKENIPSDPLSSRPTTTPCGTLSSCP